MGAEDCGVDFLGWDYHVIEFRVADDVVKVRSCCEQWEECAYVSLCVFKVARDVASEELAALADVCDDGCEVGVWFGVGGVGCPAVEVAGGAAPCATDGLPVECSGVVACSEVAKPVHVGTQFADVAHAVGVGWRGDDGVVVAGEGGAEVAGVAEVGVSEVGWDWFAGGAEDVVACAGEEVGKVGVGLGR